jgi:hypothetical protein
MVSQEWVCEKLNTAFCCRNSRKPCNQILARGSNTLLADPIQLGEYSLEQLSMSCVKALMIGRLILTWLWPVLWLVALPNAQAGVMRPADGAPTALVSATAPENHKAHDFVVHYRSGSRSTRRFDLGSTPNGTIAALWLFQIAAARDERASGFDAGSQRSLGLASSWQFLCRAALSPRAPSFVS